jgi:hypothetical protein
VDFFVLKQTDHGPEIMKHAHKDGVTPEVTEPALVSP